MKLSSLTPLALLLAIPACGPANGGVAGSSAVSHPTMTGTVFTILFENHDQSAVLNSSVPYFQELANTYGSANAYLGNTHPSLPNYLLLTSGDTHGVGDDGPPSQHSFSGTDNIADQLDAAHVPWRAYMESMGTPCSLTDSGDYLVHHNPFVYYTSLTNDTARCNDHVVDFDQNFAADLAANTYRYMWITPNVCNDMHNCDPSVSDGWLRRVVKQIQESPGYQNGGAIFILFDEGSLNIGYAESYVLHIPQNLAAIVVSPDIVSPGYQSNTTYDHLSYLATVEDMFGLPRLPTTMNATPMSDFFRSSATSSTTNTTTTNNSDAGTTSTGSAGSGSTSGG